LRVSEWTAVSESTTIEARTMAASAGWSARFTTTASWAHIRRIRHIKAGLSDEFKLSGAHCSTGTARPLDKLVSVWTRQSSDRLTTNGFRKRALFTGETSAYRELVAAVDFRAWKHSRQ